MIHPFFGIRKTCFLEDLKMIGLEAQPDYQHKLTIEPPVSKKMLDRIGPADYIPD
jgi:hypothetical protein